jgi:translation initiation factor 2 subunit 3
MSNEYIENQPTINIGMIGSVSHGKSTITERISGVKTQRYTPELERNITIKLGYANAKIFKCAECKAPECYQPAPSAIKESNCRLCTKPMRLVRHISFVDCPGHNTLMATMLNGTCVMDTTILVEAINSDLPAAQTVEHLLAAEIIGLKNDIVCVNKIDLAENKAVAAERINKLVKYFSKTVAKDSPVVPVAANYGINIDKVCQLICERIQEPDKDIGAPPKMIVIRSFNVNHNNIDINDLVGGVAGGTLMCGKLKLGDKIKILPGYIQDNKVVDEENDPKWTYKPIYSTIESIATEKTELKEVIPGGLIGVGLSVDPALTAKDRLVGNILVLEDSKEDYKVYESLSVEFEPLKDRKTELSKGDKVLLNINACNTEAQIMKVNKKKNTLMMALVGRPVCVTDGDYITISRTNGDNLTLLGRGKILDGFPSNAYGVLATRGELRSL